MILLREYVIDNGDYKNQTVENDVAVRSSQHMIFMSNVYFCKKKSWQCNSRHLNVLYLFGSIVSKADKTDIGDTLVKKSNSRLVVYLHFCTFYPFEP
jgi:hypothetical protein